MQFLFITLFAINLLTLFCLIMLFPSPTMIETEIIEVSYSFGQECIVGETSDVVKAKMAKTSQKGKTAKKFTSEIDNL